MRGGDRISLRSGRGHRGPGQGRPDAAAVIGARGAQGDPSNRDRPVGARSAQRFGGQARGVPRSPCDNPGRPAHSPEARSAGTTTTAPRTGAAPNPDRRTPPPNQPPRPARRPTPPRGPASRLAPLGRFQSGELLLLGLHGLIRDAEPAAALPD